MQSIKRLTKLFVGATIAVCALACSSGNPGPGCPSFKAGALGNGGFTFRCDDSVACDRWSNSAQNFPTKVAAGSSFELNFFAKNENGTIEIKINEAPDHRGYHIEGVQSHVGKDANGKFAVTKPGIATFMARDGKGWIVDYVTMQVFQPDGLVVYESSYKGSTPPRVQSINLTKSQRKSFRAVGEINKQPLAGAFTVDWSSADPAIVDIETISEGTATIIAKGPGTTKLIAEAAGTKEEIAVEVAQ